MLKLQCFIIWADSDPTEQFARDIDVTFVESKRNNMKKKKRTTKQNYIGGKFRVSWQTSVFPQPLSLFFSGRKWLAMDLEVRYIERIQKYLWKKLFHTEVWKGPLRNIYPKSGQACEGVWRNRGKEREAGRSVIRHLKSWASGKTEAKKQKSDVHVNTNGIKHVLRKSDHGFPRYAVFSGTLKYRWRNGSRVV